MRSHVSFRHPAVFVRLSDEDGVLAVSGAAWFLDLLNRVSHMVVNDELCQEDWGVVVFVERNRKRFWVGISMGFDGERGSWAAHFHHAPFAWLQRLSSSGKLELQRVVADFHQVLLAEPAVSEICWFRETDMRSPQRSGSSSPEDA